MYQKEIDERNRSIDENMEILQEENGAHEDTLYEASHTIHICTQWITILKSAIKGHQEAIDLVEYRNRIRIQQPLDEAEFSIACKKIDDSRTESSSIETKVTALYVKILDFNIKSEIS